MKYNIKSISSKTKKKEKKLYGGESVSISALRGFSKKMGLEPTTILSEKSIKAPPGYFIKNTKLPPGFSIKNRIVKESGKSKKIKKSTNQTNNIKPTKYENNNNTPPIGYENLKRELNNNRPKGFFKKSNETTPLLIKKSKNSIKPNNTPKAIISNSFLRPIQKKSKKRKISKISKKRKKSQSKKSKSKKIESKKIKSIKRENLKSSKKIEKSKSKKSKSKKSKKSEKSKKPKIKKSINIILEPSKTIRKELDVKEIIINQKLNETYIKILKNISINPDNNSIKNKKLLLNNNNQKYYNDNQNKKNNNQIMLNEKIKNYNKLLNSGTNTDVLREYKNQFTELFESNFMKNISNPNEVNELDKYFQEVLKFTLNNISNYNKDFYNNKLKLKMFKLFELPKDSNNINSKNIDSVEFNNNSQQLSNIINLLSIRIPNLLNYFIQGFNNFNTTYKGRSNDNLPTLLPSNIYKLNKEKITFYQELYNKLYDLYDYFLNHILLEILYNNNNNNNNYEIQSKCREIINEIYNNKLYDRLSELNKLFEELNKIKFNNNGNFNNNNLQSGFKRINIENEIILFNKKIKEYISKKKSSELKNYKNLSSIFKNEYGIKVVKLFKELKLQVNKFNENSDKIINNNMKELINKFKNINDIFISKKNLLGTLPIFDIYKKFNNKLANNNLFMFESTFENIFNKLLISFKYKGISSQINEINNREDEEKEEFILEIEERKNRKIKERENKIQRQKNENKRKDEKRFVMANKFNKIHSNIKQNIVIVEEKYSKFLEYTEKSIIKKDSNINNLNTVNFSNYFIRYLKKINQFRNLVEQLRHRYLNIPKKEFSYNESKNTNFFEGRKYLIDEYNQSLKDIINKNTKSSQYNILNIIITNNHLKLHKKEYKYYIKNLFLKIKKNLFDKLINILDSIKNKLNINSFNYKSLELILIQIKYGNENKNKLLDKLIFKNILNNLTKINNIPIENSLKNILYEKTKMQNGINNKFNYIKKITNNNNNNNSKLIENNPNNNLSLDSNKYSQKKYENRVYTIEKINLIDKKNKNFKIINDKLLDIIESILKIIKKFVQTFIDISNKELSKCKIDLDINNDTYFKYLKYTFFEYINNLRFNLKNITDEFIYLNKGIFNFDISIIEKFHMECAVLINNCIKTFIIYYIKNIKNLLTKVKKTEYRKQLIFSLDNRKIFITENILYNSLFKFLQINKNSKRYSVEIKNSSTWYKDIFNNLNSLIKGNQDIFSPIDSKN